MPRSAAPAILVALGLAGCASEPHERIVHAQFSCEDGRRLQVEFNLDQGAAIVRLSRKESLALARAGQPSARDYSGSGYRLHGVGDSITFTPPSGVAEHCVETR